MPSQYFPIGTNPPAPGSYGNCFHCGAATSSIDIDPGTACWGWDCGKCPPMAPRSISWTTKISGKLAGACFRCKNPTGNFTSTATHPLGVYWCGCAGAAAAMQATSMYPAKNCGVCGSGTHWVAVAPGVWDCGACGSSRYSSIGASTSGLPPIGAVSTPPCMKCGNGICSCHAPSCVCQSCTVAAKMFASLKQGVIVVPSVPAHTLNYITIKGIFLGDDKKKCECGSGSDGGNLHYDWCQCSPNYRAK